LEKGEGEGVHLLGRKKKEKDEEEKDEGEKEHTILTIGRACCNRIVGDGSLLFCPSFALSF